jgi:hypothetical protein
LLKTMHDSEKKPDPEYKTNTKTSNSPLPT